MRQLPERVLLQAHLVRDMARQYANKHYGDIDALTLNGACAIASYELARRIRGKLVVGTVGWADDDHAWVEYRGWWIDITATQYDERSPSVLVARRGELRGYRATHVGKRAVREIGHTWYRRGWTNVLRTQHKLRWRQDK